MCKIVIIRVIIKLMARLTIKEIINRGYITSVELAVGLMDGTYTLEDDIIKEGLTQVGVYDEVYNPESEEVEETVTEEPVDETVTEPDSEVTEETVTEEPVEETVTEEVTEEPVEETVTEPDSEVTEETVTEEVTEEPVEETEKTVTEEDVTEETVTEEPVKETEETVTETTKDINKCSEILDKAVELDIVHKSGSWYSYSGTKLGQGKTAIINTLSGNPELLEEIEAKVIEQTNNDVSESK